MAVLEAAVTTAGGAASAMLGVLVGGMIGRRAQDRHWLRDKQQAAYQELLSQYATFVMIIRRANLGKAAGWDYDWALWSAALTSVSLVAPPDVVMEVERFDRAVETFLSKAAVDTSTSPLSESEFDKTMVRMAQAQISLVNVIRRSLGKDQEPLSIHLGGSAGSKAD